MKKTVAEKRTCLTCLRYLLIVFNLLFWVISIAVIGFFSWLAVDQIWVIKGVLGTDLAMVSVVLLIIAGCLLFIFSIFGIIAVAKENVKMIIIYMCAIILIMLTFTAAVVCIAVFKTWLTEPVRNYMKDQLKNVYGTNLNDNWNYRVTISWDKAQTSWQCCSAEDKSWAYYQKSTWYMQQPGTPDSGKPYVPASCCMHDDRGIVSDANLKICQTSQPPDIGGQYQSNIIPPVYSRGCFESAKDFLLFDEVSWFTAIFGVGIGGALLMLGCLVFTILLCSMQTSKNKYDKRNLLALETNSGLSNEPSNYSDKFNNSRSMLPPQYTFSMV